MFSKKKQDSRENSPDMVFQIEDEDLREKVIRFDVGQTLLECALESRVSLSHSCGGMGTCGTCRVIIVDSATEMPERNEIETEMAQERAFSGHERLACQVEAQAGLKVRIPHST